MWQWGEGESFRRGFLLHGDSVTSLYRGQIQNVSTQWHTCTCRILLQYEMLESERYQIHHLSAVIIHCDETAKFAGLSSSCFTLDHTQAQREESIMYGAAHCQWNKAFGFSPFISDSGRLSLCASVHAAADAVTLCNSVHLFTHCSPLPTLSLSHPNFK